MSKVAEGIALSAYIKKLSHPLKEIRERALQLLAAKLRLGWELNDELSDTRQLLEALLAWFNEQQPSLQSEALHLFIIILKSKSGTYIAKEFGISELLKKLSVIKQKIEPDALDLYEDVLDTLRFLNTVHSTDSLCVPRLNLVSGTSSDTDTRSNCEFEHLGSNFRTPKDSPRSNVDTASSQYYDNKKIDGVKVLLFPWADICSSDSKTVLLLEDALKLLKSTRRCCRFIRDVFLRDFPAEIFLNRPAIITNLIAKIEASHNGKSSESLDVLLCITRALRMRLRELSSLELIHESNVIVDNKQSSDDSVNVELEEITSDLRNLTGFARCDDGLQALRQLPAPVFVLDTLYTILSVMARSAVVFDPKEKIEILELNELNTCMNLVECLIELLLDCVSATFWRMDHSTKTYRDIAHKSCMAMRMIGDLLNKYRSSFLSDLEHTHQRVVWLRLVSCGEKLLHWCRDSALPPASLVSSLQMAHLDSSLELFYPKISAELSSALQNTRLSNNKEFKSKYKELKNLFIAMEEAVKFMKNKDSCRSSKNILKCIKNSVPILDLNVNDTFLKDVSSILLTTLKKWDLNDDDWSEARAISLRLMSHNSDIVRGRFYCKMAEMVKSVFVEDNSDQLSHEKGLMLLCDVSILTEMCCHGLSDSSKEVAESASEIMLYLLRGRLILSEGSWWRLLASLLPAMPLLHAYAAHDTLLGQAICKSLEPGIAECMGVTKADSAAGLVRLLFVQCPSVQMEAAHALCRMLDDSKYLPPQESLRSDVLVSALRRVQPQDFNIDFSKSPTKQPQISSLIQVLDVLKQDLVLEEETHGLSEKRIHREPMLEPTLRRATLQQLAVLMMQHDLHETFEQCDGILIVVTTLRMSFLVDDFMAFPECAISCVSVLNSISYSSRHTLAKIRDLPALLLRVILIFPANESAVLMSAQVLAVCSWAGFTLQELDEQRRRVLALPACVLQRTRLPFTARAYWATSPNAVHSAVEWLQTEEEWRAAIRVRWASTWSSSWLLEGAAPAPGPLALRPTTQDIEAAGAASPLVAFSRALLTLSNATDHRRVNHTLALLVSYTHLVSKSNVKCVDLASLPWRDTLARFLRAPPASPRDVALLTNLLKFLLAYVDNVPKEAGTLDWVKISFLDSDTSMISLLSRDRLYPQQTSQDCIEVTQLHIHVVKMILRCVLLMESDANYSSSKAETLLKILLVCLEKIDLKDFHMLGYLNEVMRCIRYIVSSPRCELSEECVIQCMRLMSETLTGSGGGNGRKGQGCRLDAVLSLQALLIHVQRMQLPHQRWCDAFSGSMLAALETGSAAPPAARAAVVRLLAALAPYTPLLPHLATAVPNRSLSQYATAKFCERGEANCVRAASAALLTALSSRTSPHTDVLTKFGYTEKGKHAMEAGVRLVTLNEYSELYSWFTSPRRCLCNSMDPDDEYMEC